MRNRFLLSATAAFIIASCLSCEYPKAPSFTTVLKIPLSKDAYTIADLKEDIENGKDSLRLEIQNDSVLFVITDDESVEIGDDLQSDPTVDSAQGLVNNDLKFRDSATTSYSLGRLAPGGVDALHNTTATIPLFTINNTSNNITYNNFVSATIVSGTLRTVLTNNMQVPCTLTVVIFNSVNQTRIDSFVVTNIGANGGTSTRTRTFSSALTVNTPITIRVNGSSPGSSSPVLVDTALAVSAKLVFDVTASSITGKFPSQTLARMDSIKTSTNSVIDTGYIQRGDITLTFRNRQLAVGTSVLFTSSDFIDPSGAALSRTVNVAAGNNQTTVLNINVAGWKIRPRQTSVGNQHFVYNYTLTTNASTSDATVIANNQGIIVTARIDTLYFSRMRGVLSQEQVSIDPRGQEIDIDSDLDTIRLQTAFFELVTEHKIPFPSTLDITVKGKSAKGVVRTVSFSGNIGAYTSGTDPRRDTIRSPANQSANIAALLSILPDSVIINGQALVGNGVVSGAIQNTDSLKVKVYLRTPLIFQLPSDTTKNIIQSDPAEFDLGSEAERIIPEHFSKVTITGFIRNHFPIPVDVQFLVNNVAHPDSFYIRLDDSAFVYPPQPLLVDKGTVDANGRVTAPNEVQLSYVLTPQQFRRIFVAPDFATKYRGVKVRLRGTGATPVRVSANDYVEIDADMEVEFDFDEDVLK